MAPFANVTVFVDVSAKGDVKEKALMLAGSSSYYIGKPGNKSVKMFPLKTRQQKFLSLAMNKKNHSHRDDQ